MAVIRINEGGSATTVPVSLALSLKKMNQVSVALWTEGRSSTVVTSVLIRIMESELANG